MRSLSSSPLQTPRTSPPTRFATIPSRGKQGTEFFFASNLPSDTGMAFVLVSHLDPHHKSILPELLSKHTTLEVLQAQNEVKVEPNNSLRNRSQ